MRPRPSPPPQVSAKNDRKNITQRTTCHGAVAVRHSLSRGEGERRTRQAQQLASLIGRGGVHDRQERRPRTRAMGEKGDRRKKKQHSAATSPPSESLPSRRPRHGIQVPAGVRLARPQPTQVTPPATRATAPHQGPALSVRHLAVAAEHRRAFLRCSAAGGAARSAAVQRRRRALRGETARRPQKKRQGSPRPTAPAQRTDNATARERAGASQVCTAGERRVDRHRPVLGNYFDSRRGRASTLTVTTAVTATKATQTPAHERAAVNRGHEVAVDDGNRLSWPCRQVQYGYFAVLNLGLRSYFLSNLPGFSH